MSKAMLKEYGKVWAAGMVLTSSESVESIERWLKDNIQRDWNVSSIGASFMQGKSSFKILFEDENDKASFSNMFPG